MLGAELKCRHGSESSYLIVYAKDIDVGGLPDACVSDCMAYMNIMPFGQCRCGGPCEKHMDLEKQWENMEPQKTLTNGKEIITTKSILTCSRIGAEIKAVASGQDGEAGKQIAEWMKVLIETEEKYPGLTGILTDPYGSLYLNEGMYEKAVQFLEDCIRKNGGELALSELDTDNRPEIQLVKTALNQLILEFDAQQKK